MTGFGTIQAERGDGFLELTLDRPEMLNPLDEQVADELCAALASAERDDDVRAVLLRGEGRAFSAGGNVKVMERSLEGNPAAFFEQPLARIHEAALAVARLPMPVVAAVHGFVSGAAFNLAMACDFVLCAEGTRFNQAFVRLGLVPDTGGTYFLPRLVGLRRALELMMLGEFVDAERALGLGLVNRVVPAGELVPLARELAGRLASGPTRAYGEIKRLVHDSAARGLGEALDAERETQLRVAASEDFLEGVRAFLEKREPRFRGR